MTSEQANPHCPQAVTCPPKKRRSVLDTRGAHLHPLFAVVIDTLRGRLDESFDELGLHIVYSHPRPELIESEPLPLLRVPGVPGAVLFWWHRQEYDQRRTNARDLGLRGSVWLCVALCDSAGNTSIEPRWTYAGLIMDLRWT